MKISVDGGQPQVDCIGILIIKLSQQWRVSVCFIRGIIHIIARHATQFGGPNAEKTGRRNCPHTHGRTRLMGEEGRRLAAAGT